jgi:hypothetical protein
MTAKIARAHLNEFPDYYTRLAKMEAEAEAETGGTVSFRVGRRAVAIHRIQAVCPAAGQHGPRLPDPAAIMPHARHIRPPGG